MQHVAHWDDVEPRRREVGHLAGTWRDLGRAVGTEGVGVQRIDVDAGRWSTPAHVEGAAEEIFYVLEGSGLSWQDGAVYEIFRAGYYGLLTNVFTSVFVSRTLFELALVRRQAVRLSI